MGEVHVALFAFTEGDAVRRLDLQQLVADGHQVFRGIGQEYAAVNMGLEAVIPVQVDGVVPNSDLN